MHDAEKVIKKAECIMCSTVDRNMINSFCEDVLALLKEQETTTFKPHYIDEYGTHFIYGVECGSCHEKISRTYHYCPYCGKAVKWNE